MGDLGDVETALGALDISLDSTFLKELNSPEANALRETIDSLRELEIGQRVSLPQIIVVGDQSSGKSSVLEAISRVRFPAKGGICTRFATELVLKRAPEPKINVRIKALQSESDRQFERTSFDKNALPDIISDATKAMEIAPGSYSRDILHVEISGPDVYPVTLIDLPGLFRNATSDQKKEGITIVQEIADQYMSQPASIILAVVSANGEFANQTAAAEAAKHDPDGKRTVGVITKPDLAVPGSDGEKKFLQLAKGEEVTSQLRLGWHVLCNRPEGRESLSAEARDRQEAKFFQTGVWSNIAETSRGITQLRRKLSLVLLDHIRTTLPNLIHEIEDKLSRHNSNLKKLGAPRTEPEELRTYLIDIADKFQRLARDAVHGHYNDEFFGNHYQSNETRKLRALFRNLNRAFHATLVMKGVERKIDWDDDKDCPIDNGGFDWTETGREAPEFLKPFLNLFDGVSTPKSISETNLRKELENLGAANQGREFPDLPNGELAFLLFRMQAKPWKGIADAYLDQVIDFAKAFVEDLFSHIIGGDQRTTNAVLVLHVATFFESKRTTLKEKLEEVLRPYVSAYGPPLDAEFHATFSSGTIQREAGRVASLLEERFPAIFTEKGGKRLFRQEIEVAIRVDRAKPSQFGTERVIHMAMTHYQMSLRTFTENVINLAAENCLVSALPAILTPAMVIRMSETHLKELASESEEIQIRRKLLEREAKIFREGLEKCQKSRLHERTVLPMAFANTASSSGLRIVRSEPATPPSSSSSEVEPISSGKRNAAPVSVLSQSINKSSSDNTSSSGGLFTQSQSSEPHFSVPKTSSGRLFAQTVSSANPFVPRSPSPQPRTNPSPLNPSTAPSSKLFDFSNPPGGPSASLFGSSNPSTVPSGGLFGSSKPSAPPPTTLFDSSKASAQTLFGKS